VTSPVILAARSVSVLQGSIKTADLPSIDEELTMIFPGARSNASVRHTYSGSKAKVGGPCSRVRIVGSVRSPSRSHTSYSVVFSDIPWLCE